MRISGMSTTVDPTTVRALAPIEENKGSTDMNFGRKTIIAALMTGSMALGALAAAVTGAGSIANAATNTGQVKSVRAAGPNGTFVSNEDPAHEATESAAREAQEDAGQMPTVP
jgi:hypothetical protein